MGHIRVGLVADPAKPTALAQGMTDLQPSDGSDDTWDITVVSEPFTTGSEDVETAVDRLHDHARQRNWDVVIGLTELPLHNDEGRHLVAETDAARGTSVLSLPALGGLRMHSRTRSAVRSLIGAMADPDSDPEDENNVSLPKRRGRWRLLMGMVLANRPWLLIPGLKSALVSALATGAIATINSTVWLLAGSLSWWRLVVATFVSIALAVGWLVIDGRLWDRPRDDSPQARERSRLYNASTLVTLTAGVSICYIALYLVNLAWAFFVLQPSVAGGFLRMSFGYHDLFVLAWFVASAATVGGGLGSGFESDEAIRAAAYSKREEERRERLARERDQDEDRDQDRDQDGDQVRDQVRDGDRDQDGNGDRDRQQDRDRDREYSSR
jgi:hypothetical protein